jgi:phage recombination protein Bet
MSEAALAVVKQHEPAVVLTKEDIKRYICADATDKEIFMFLGICKSFGLNPLKREVHLIKYGNAPASIVTGYEVYLKRAERTGKLNGWKVDIVQDGKAATVTIHRKDWERPFEWTAYRQEFDKGQANWKTMPLFMLRKVAMAQAFRICFPDEMGGLPYLPEEISGNVSESLPAGPMVETVVSVPATASQDAPGSTQPPTVTIGTVQIPLVPPAPVHKEADSSSEQNDARDELALVCSQIADIMGMDAGSVLYQLTINKAGKFGKRSPNDIQWEANGPKGIWYPLKAVLSKAKKQLEELQKPTDDDVIPEDDIKY